MFLVFAGNHQGSLLKVVPQQVYRVRGRDWEGESPSEEAGGRGISDAEVLGSRTCSLVPSDVTWKTQTE